MKKEVPGKCPVCSNTTFVTEVHCDNCNTTISGSFSLCTFCKLTRDQKEFAEIFIRNRGNIKEIEKALSISYPTVKGKLDNLIEALDNIAEPTSSQLNIEVLERLNSGEISADEAYSLLNE